MVLISHLSLSVALSNTIANNYAKCYVTFEEIINFIDANKAYNIESSKLLYRFKDRQILK